MHSTHTKLPAAAFESEAPPKAKGEEVSAIEEALQTMQQDAPPHTPPALQALLEEFAPEAAVRIFAAEQAAKAAKEEAIEEILFCLQARQALPQLMRADAAAAPVRDYMAMSPEEFAIAEQQMRQQARNGMRITL